ncbi:hypothetical protein [Curtobacterium sp. L1-20]|uniref:hypothetical protein n=1 Tax=Curtobacterium sp. L1-20 TaxID=3138181 RepID=UPI003B51B4DC
MRGTRTTVIAVTGTVLTGMLLTGCTAFGGDDSVPEPTRRAAVDGSRPTRAPEPSTEAVTAKLSVPAGTVVAETDVVSASGGTSIHVRVVADGDGTFDAKLSGYRTSQPQPMTIEFRRAAVGGPDPSGFRAGVVQWDSGVTPPSSVSLGDAGPTPDYLHSVVLVPAPSGGDDSARPWVGNVLAAAALDWTLPNPYPGLRVTAGPDRSGAQGWVHDDAGVPASYQVATGDEQAAVADRLGLTLAQLRWLNPTLQTGVVERLITDTDLNLDPARR